MKSLAEMPLKVMKKVLNSNDLRADWKWMKELGHNYNMSEKWKIMLSEMVGIPLH